jgi:hypothetical protein
MTYSMASRKVEKHYSAIFYWTHGGTQKKEASLGPPIPSNHLPPLDLCGRRGLGRGGPFFLTGFVGRGNGSAHLPSLPFLELDAALNPVSNAKKGVDVLSRSYIILS